MVAHTVHHKLIYDIQVFLQLFLWNISFDCDGYVDKLNLLKIGMC
jgi:hypothetical protein